MGDGGASCQDQDFQDYGIFRIFPARLRAGQTLIYIIRFGGICGYGENGELGEIEILKILKIPPILKILILTAPPKPRLQREQAFGAKTI